jgi:hypothetical protein
VPAGTSRPTMFVLSPPLCVTRKLADKGGAPTIKYQLDYLTFAPLYLFPAKRRLAAAAAAVSVVHRRRRRIERPMRVPQSSAAPLRLVAGRRATLANCAQAHAVSPTDGQTHGRAFTNILTHSLAHWLPN